MNSQQVAEKLNIRQFSMGSTVSSLSAAAGRADDLTVASHLSFEVDSTGQTREVDVSRFSAFGLLVDIIIRVRGRLGNPVIIV